MGLPPSFSKPRMDVVFVACKRPEIIKLTLESFSKNLLDQFDVRLIVNIDPIGEDQCTQNDVAALCQSYFDNVIFRMPETASFSHAVKWCWEQVETDYFLHLEDDWCLKSYIDYGRLLAYMKDDDVVSVRLSSRDNHKYESYQGDYVFSDAFSLNPSIMRSRYINGLLARFNTEKDPEKQFACRVTEDYTSPKLLVYGGSDQKAIVIDTGTKWRKRKGLLKWNEASSKNVSWVQKSACKKRLFYYLKYNLYLRYWKLRYC